MFFPDEKAFEIEPFPDEKALEIEPFPDEKAFEIEPFPDEKAFEIDDNRFDFSAFGKGIISGIVIIGQMYYD